MRHPQHGANLCHAPGQTAHNAMRAQWAILQTGPCAQGLRAAVQVMRGLFGRYTGAALKFQRRELLGLRYSAAGVCAVFGCCLHFSPFRHVDLCRGVNSKSTGVNGKNRASTPGRLSLCRRELQREKTGIAYLCPSPANAFARFASRSFSAASFRSARIVFSSLRLRPSLFSLATSADIPVIFHSPRL